MNRILPFLQVQPLPIWGDRVVLHPDDDTDTVVTTIIRAWRPGETGHRDAAGRPGRCKLCPHHACVANEFGVCSISVAALVPGPEANLFRRPADD